MHAAPAVVALALLAGCGQAGPLVLPDGEPRPQVPAAPADSAPPVGSDPEPLPEKKQVP